MKNLLVFLTSTASIGNLFIYFLAIGNPTIAAETQPVTIRFQAKVGTQSFRCGETYDLGTPATKVTATDFRFYVSDVALIDAQGRQVPVTLQQDGKWQSQSVALLDFENKSRSCTNGTAETRDRVIGTVPKGTYRGIQFTLGVPFALNHADSTLAASPLNLTSLWWNWQGGYKFLRIDLVQTPKMHGAGTRQLMAHNSGADHDSSDPAPHSKPGKTQGFAIHIGSTACQSSTKSQAPISCANSNRPEIQLANFDPGRNTIVADLAALLASTQLSSNQPNSPPGCMSSPDDRDCLGILHSLGLPFQGQAASGQTFFRVE